MKRESILRHTRERHFGIHRSSQ
ncbi:hypothetical protein ID866_6053 [Astraeus odoratus]|nr:hypothetical protein ID866_6053 [Astraeus odoratus]